MTQVVCFLNYMGPPIKAKIFDNW